VERVVGCLLLGDDRPDDPLLADLDGVEGVGEDDG
jgi:hypothetical protein